MEGYNSPVTLEIQPVLARAGIMDGYHMTVHWEHAPAVAERVERVGDLAIESRATLVDGARGFVRLGRQLLAPAIERLAPRDRQRSQVVGPVRVLRDVAVEHLGAREAGLGDVAGSLGHVADPAVEEVLDARHADGVAKDLEDVFSYFPVLKERADQRAGSLSGGEQQMLAISRALMSQPKCLMKRWLAWATAWGPWSRSYRAPSVDPSLL